MALKKSKFRSGQTVFAKWPRREGGTVIITLIKYIPNYEWYAEFSHPDTNEVARDYFDEREFD